MIRVSGIVPLVAAVASLFLAVVVHKHAPDRTLGRVFGFLAICLVFWNMNFFVLYAIDDYAIAFDLSWAFRTGAVFLLPAILHLSVVLPGRPVSSAWRWVLAIDYSWAAALALANLQGHLVVELAKFDWGYYSVGTRIYNFFPVLVLLNFVVAVTVLWREYFTTAEPRMRLQLKFWLFGMAIALPLGLTNLLPSYGIPFYPLGNLGSAVWAGVVGYAIVRHRLMDIELVLTRGLSYALVCLGLVGPVAGVTTLLQRWAFGEVHYDFSMALAGLLIVVGLLFSRLESLIEERLERSLFPQKVESRARLDALADEVVRILDRSRLLEVLTGTVHRAFQVDRVALYLREDTRGHYALRGAVGVSPATADFTRDSPAVRWLTARREPVLRDEAPLAAVADEASSIGAILDLERWEVGVPFLAGESLLGFMCLGRRAGMQAFSAGDLALLGRVAAEASVALQNAHLYDELRRSREIINRAGRLSALGTLAAGIAHEIRNPLVSIQTFFQLAPERINDEEFMTSFLGLAEAEVQRISSLISELLMFAKSPSTTFGCVDVQEVVERVVLLLEPQAKAQRVELIASIGKETGGVLADPDQIVQVLINLVLNAIQATPGGGRVTVAARNTVSDHISYVQIEVCDTGAGIAESIRESIFDPFFTTKDRGSGLGLAISHQIVVETGGYIAVESEEGHGSRFLVNLPVFVDEGHASDGDDSFDRKNLCG